MAVGIPLDPVGIPLLGRLKRQAMNLALQSKYSLGDAPPTERLIDQFCIPSQKAEKLYLSYLPQDWTWHKVIL